MGCKHRNARSADVLGVKVFKDSKQHSSTIQRQSREPFFNKTAQVKDNDTGGLMTRHLTSEGDVSNLKSEVSTHNRSTDFFGGKDTFF